MRGMYGILCAICVLYTRELERRTTNASLLLPLFIRRWYRHNPHYFSASCQTPLAQNPLTSVTHNPEMFIPRDIDEEGGLLAPGVGSGTEAGASGSSDGYGISTGGLIAIVVVVVVVAILGSECRRMCHGDQAKLTRIATMGALFFIAKKREWTMKETLRRSARKVKTALTPRRAEFPSHLKDPEDPSSRWRQHTRLEDVPPTPGLRPEDLEKGRTKTVIESRGRR
jgi:hypothetical protein